MAEEVALATPALAVTFTASVADHITELVAKPARMRSAMT